MLEVGFVAAALAGLLISIVAGDCASRRQQRAAILREAREIVRQASIAYWGLPR